MCLTKWSNYVIHHLTLLLFILWLSLSSEIFQALKDFQARQKFGRFCTAEEVANLILFLASDEVRK